MRSQALSATDEQDSNVKRVKVEAIDFDWIFGENGKNAENFIRLLTQQDNTKMFVQKSIRVFIELLWEHYQPAIVRKVFFKYIFYLILVIGLSSQIAGAYLHILTTGRNDDHAALYKVETVGFSVGILFFWLFFFKIEIQQLIQLGWGYFGDTWNVIDMTSLVLNMSQIVTLNINVWAGKIIIDANLIRAIGAVGCFVMWVKVFYWMRLFKSTAPFVTLIMTTLADIKVFMIMLIIIILAFANFYYILNLNAIADKATKDKPYVGDYGFNGVTNALINAYFTSLGEFDFDNLGEHGANRYLAWIGFLMASFIMLIVFMNMLIAIMGDTFGNVQAVAEENALKE
jgi:hypothetical protein